ncbi:MAG: hypothetical protein JWO46_2098 [Nocardioidaceae bacterium]|nr:hypothetical protein [Nocardioidaceae bacterium]
MTTKLAMVTLDCGEVAPVATFWASFLELDTAASTDDYAMLTNADGPAIGFGRVDDYTPPAWPNEHGSKQFHFDVAVDDIPAAEEKAIGLGATLADPQPGETWRVLIDPAGHPFCLTDAANWG